MLIEFSVADLGGLHPASPPPRPQGPKFSQFHAVFCKIWQNHMFAPPGGLAPPPMGNPGSAPGFLVEMYIIFNVSTKGLCRG